MDQTFSGFCLVSTLLDLLFFTCVNIGLLTFLARYSIFRFLHLFEEIARTSLLNCIFLGIPPQHDRKSEILRISPILIRRKVMKLKIPKFLSWKRLLMQFLMFSKRPPKIRKIQNGAWFLGKNDYSYFCSS